MVKGKTLKDVKSAFYLMEKEVGYYQASEVIHNEFGKHYLHLSVEDYDRAITVLNEQRLKQRNALIYDKNSQIKE